jgi:hypothetical protein
MQLCYPSTQFQWSKGNLGGFRGRVSLSDVSTHLIEIRGNNPDRNSEVCAGSRTAGYLLIRHLMGN